MIPNFIWNHLTEIIHSYTGQLPLSDYLKNYFKVHPNAGSRDRKVIVSLLYSWYRCSKVVRLTEMQDPGEDFKKKMAICLKLSAHNSSNQLLDDLQITDKYAIDLDAIFPFSIEFSSDIDRMVWLQSMQVQPDLFIRLRKDKDKIVRLLNERNIPFKFISDTCLALPNSTKIDQVLPADAYVVQDASSQQTAKYMRPQKNERWYDCCCGAGGKSLLLKDLEPVIDLTVSDKRASIVHNLVKRFLQYGFKAPSTFILDVTDRSQMHHALGNARFNHIICDVPCSGSGTWARTPEQLYFFNRQQFEKFPQLQEDIAVNASEFLKHQGTLIYITCSVFRQENEEVVDNIIQKTGMHLVESLVITGINFKADSMFVAVLRNNGKV